MARPTKLTKALQSKIVAALKTGATVADMCQHVGIGESTFYLWQDIGQACIDGRVHDRAPETDAEKARYIEFVEAVISAQADAKAAAMKVLRTAMEPHQQVSTKVKTYKETRINKVTGEPYEYVEVQEEKTITTFPGDWRAGVEYLKRRHFDEWGDKSKQEISGTLGIEDVRTLSDDELNDLLKS